jgi:hypothetical protein
MLWLRRLVASCHHGVMNSCLGLVYNLGSEQHACWWPHFRGMVSPHRHRIDRRFRGALLPAAKRQSILHGAAFQKTVRRVTSGLLQGAVYPFT